MTTGIRLRCIIVAAACVMTVQVTAGGAHAYVLPAPHILDLLVDRLGSAKSLEISQKTVFLDLPGQSPPCPEGDRDCPDQKSASQTGPSAVGVDSGARALQETVRYDFPRAFRSDFNAPPTDRTHIFSGGRSATVVDGTISPRPESYFDYYKHLLLHRSRSRLMSRLAERGINTDVSSLGLFDNRTAFVLGANFPDLTVPQVWIDKETLLPMRWIVQGANPGEEAPAFEIRYFEWRKIGRIWYPDQIEFYRSGTTVRLIQVEDYVLNPKFSPELFRIDRLLARSQPAGAQSGQGPGTGAMGEVQRTIEEFRRLFE